jgi:hypothetical protein
MANEKALGWAGLGLMLLGFMSFGLVYLQTEVNAQSLQLAAGTGLLVGLGASTIVTAGLRRLEARVAVLEARVGEPDKRASS